MIKKRQIDMTGMREGESFSKYLERLLEESNEKIVFVDDDLTIISDSWQEGLEYSLTSRNKKIGDKL